LKTCVVFKIWIFQTCVLRNGERALSKSPSILVIILVIVSAKLEHAITSARHWHVKLTKVMVKNLGRVHMARTAEARRRKLRHRRRGGYSAEELIAVGIEDVLRLHGCRKLRRLAEWMH